MRPHAIIGGVALLLLVSLGACSISASDDDAGEQPTATTGSETTGSELFTDLAVCSREEAGDAGCPLDQSGEPLEASDVLCSTAYSGESDSVSIRLDHEGEEVFTQDITGVQAQLGSADSVPLTGFFGTGTLTIPGGSYTCSFDDGTDEVSLDFDSAGEPGPAAYTWTCDELDTVTEDNSTFCTSDTESLSEVDAFTCSTVLTGVLEQSIDVRLAVTDSTIDSEDVLELTGGAPLGILVAHVTLIGEQLVGRPGATVPVGTYTCEWLVAGEPVDADEVEVTG